MASDRPHGSQANSYFYPLDIHSSLDWCLTPRWHQGGREAEPIVTFLLLLAAQNLPPVLIRGAHSSVASIFAQMHRCNISRSSLDRQQAWLQSIARAMMNPSLLTRTKA